ncbi:Retrovirus-related Pol polyprotein from transposon [Trichinella nelsoni]|uniref:Retrovirus-related Pol polyprotein from transposon n=1 Tax=Trichinella nelsoni TaxID=6336 RepID=A0A0V0RSY0_9BILA|nr:Retrovirus-related Pol polyprotein from transposon [Trichinella nelsoni]
MTANTIARTLVNEFICRYGAPESLHSDQGRNFEAALIKELCETFDIHKTRTTPYHPQSSGLVERFHRTLLTMLSARATTYRRNWDLVLPMTLLAYRTSINESTKATPYRIMFGREAALPIDVMYGLPEIPPQTPAEYIWKLRNDLADSFKEIREKLKTESRRQKKWYDRGTTDYKFNIDGKVWLATPKKDKLDRMWEGPYRILQQVGQNIYKVSKVSSLRKKLIVHVGRLKRWYGTNPNVMQTRGRTPEQQVEADNNEERSHNVIITTSNQPEQETSQEEEPQAEASPVDKEGTLQNTDWLKAIRARKAEVRIRKIIEDQEGGVLCQAHLDLRIGVKVR